MRPLFVLLLVLAGLAPAVAAPIEFAFRPEAIPGNPFVRELWAEVTTPHGLRVLPAFFRGEGVWAVRARAATAGTYSLGPVTETVGDALLVRAAAAVGPTQVQVDRPDPLGGPIRIDPRRPRRFVDGAGAPFYPLGANFPWPDREASPDEYYPPTFAAAAAAGLNWARVWMAHWGQLNLDWRATPQGASPEPGTLLLDVAARWDRLLEAAAAHGIRVQVVLQHHGQYSSQVNSNWDENPWNVANGGFLATPVEFFTSPRARELTRRKFRYIVARWGYSPAVFAWELFNEVKWTDARAGGAASNAAVADWHHEMARYLRRLDPERHLVTTSDDHLGHPLYATMDFFQPHLYARNMLAGVRRFDVDPSQLDRPIFYGEVGDDHLPDLAPEWKESGRANLPLAWAGLMNEAHYPAQLWYASKLVRSGGWDGLHSLAAFVRACGLDRRDDLVAFSPAIRAAERMPLTIEPGMFWHRMPAPTVQVPFDGSVPAELANVPSALVWSDDPKQGLEPFPSAMTLVFDYPRDATAVLRFSDAHPAGASVRVRLDGEVVGEHVWSALPEDQRADAPPRPRDFILPLKPGRRTLVIDNPHGPEWVAFKSLSTGMDVPLLAAAGRRAADRVVLWIYHRTGVFSAVPRRPAEADILLSELAPGRWRITWWEMAAGAPGASIERDHGGGTFQLESPPIAEHAAVWLERL